jgi:hypothetical protein
MQGLAAEDKGAAPSPAPAVKIDGGARDGSSISTSALDGGSGSTSGLDAGIRSDLAATDGGQQDASFDLTPPPPPPPPLDPDIKAKLEALEAQNDLFLDQIGNRQTVLKNAIVTVGTALAGGGTPTPPSVRELFRATGEMVVSQVLKHEGSVYSVNYSVDGKRLVSAASDGAARVYDTATMQLLQTLKGHSQEVTHAAFSVDGKRVVTASADRTARIWDTATGKSLLTLTGHNQEVNVAAFSRDGSRVVTAGGDNQARIWDARTGRSTLTLSGHDGPVLYVAFSPDGSRSRHRQRRRHRPTVGRLLGTLHLHPQRPQRGRHLGGLFPERQPRADRGPRQKGDHLGCTSTGRSHLNIFDPEDGIRTAQYSADGLRVITSSSNRIARVWDAISGRALYVLKGHTQDVRAAVFSPDMARAATASSDGNVRVWDIRSGRYGQIFQSKFELNSAMPFPLMADASSRLTSITTPCSGTPRPSAAWRCSAATPPRSTGARLLTKRSAHRHRLE